MRPLQRSWFVAALTLVLAACMSAFVRCPASSLLRPKRAPHSTYVGQARGFGGSTRSHKAIPFSLQSSRATTAENNAPTGSAGESQVLRMLMFGKPGAGKGTLSQRLVKKYDILSLSTGDLLRQHITEK